MRELMQPFFRIYPDRDVAVGETWLIEHEVTASFPHTQVNTYELLERSGGVCKLGLSSQVSTPEGGASMDMGVLALELTMNGTQSGTLTLDEATGMVVDARIESSFSGEIGMAEEGLDPWPMTSQLELVLREVK